MAPATLKLDVFNSKHSFSSFQQSLPILKKKMCGSNSAARGREVRSQTYLKHKVIAGSFNAFLFQRFPSAISDGQTSKTKKHVG